MTTSKNQVGFTPQPEGRGFSPTLLIKHWSWIESTEDKT